MSATAIAAPRPTGLPTRALASATVWLAVFLGGFVFIEPAPYDLFLALVIPIWMIAGLKVPRAIGPLIVLLILFCAGGVLAATQAKTLEAQPIYYAVTAFLALSAVFFACLTASDGSKFDLVVEAWIVAAVVTVILGVLGYFGVVGDLFTKFGRASGGFQDPNVFGPFLIFPLLILIRRVLTGSLRSSLASGILALILLAGLFLSFSRASWGLAVLGTLSIGGLLFVMEQRAAMRARFIGIAAAGLVVLLVMLTAILSIPAVSDLFEQRAQVVQDYDGGHMGRFERHAAGFKMMLDHPLGIGAMEFGKIYGEDEHDIWLKSLTSYGWLGFASFVALVVWTLAAAFPLVFRSSPTQGVAQTAYIVLLGHILMASVIDIDHWRHVFLLFGLLWGAIAADRAASQKRFSHAWPAEPATAGQPFRA